MHSYNQQLTRCTKVLQNTIIRGVTICNNRSPSSMLKTCAPYYCCDYATRSPITFARNVLAGKHLDVYIFPSMDFCASRVDYLDIYTINLESDVNFTVFYDLIYLYIYTFYCSWSSCNWATYPKVLLYTLAYFSLNSIVSVIRIHDKYQSLILIGLALTEKASSRIQHILFHFQSYWRGWGPLVTPWACCIKEGIEPRISYHLRADPGNGPCQRQVLAEYTNNNNNQDISEVVLSFSCPGKCLSLLPSPSLLLFLLLLFLLLLLLLLLCIFTCKGFLL